ncbi:syntaxin-16-like isoform X1 [Myxocyprinus asiaticus]|uniref:syntaxin-16-like isoform X1 n=1 Tax=Myxocyprinus asiaticus TaxID=70543 RepID=UPI002223DECE|nr:syntaxin-16-like isoform X1 [Myxocyprinus asiaticus]
MATRRLTDAFLLMRNNAIQNRQILAEQVSTYDPRRTLNTRSNAALVDDRMALVTGISLDPEAAISVSKRLPPKWVEGVDEIQYEITRIRQKMKELANLHDKHMNRPTLDDSSEEEHAIEITTQEITQMFHRCQRAVTGLQTQSYHCIEQEKRLLTNVVSSLAQSLQELSVNFRHTQSSYLKRMKNREERSKHFFDSGPLMEEDEDIAVYDRGFTDDQLVLVQQNTVMVEEREREIRQIVQSISDLNEIFRDLAGMVVEQCTSPSCSKAPPQHDAATPMLHGWDGVLRLASLTLFPPNITMVIIAKQFNFRPEDISPKTSSQGPLLLFWD